MLALASLFWSIIIFPWWNNLSIFGETNFLAKIKTFIAAQNIDLSEKTILEFWFFTRSIRDIITDFLYTFIVSYWICCLFVNRYTVAITLISKSFLCCLFVILPYAIVESSYLYLQADWAKNILSIINPILYDIPAQSEQKWWPPMFWPEARMRNVFAEPSYFGVWLVLLLPGLWYWLYVTKDKKWIASFSCLLGYISIFLTTARSAYCLAFGELFLLILSACFIHKKNFTKYVVNITIYFILALCISFTISQLSFNKQSRFSEYIYDNALNITSTKERSNESRYSIFFAHIQTGIESPLLGVGNVLVKAYLPKYLSHQEQKNGEIKNWLILQKEKGFLHSPIPELSEYSTRFAEKGILGLFIYILPFCVGSVLLFFRLSKEIYTEQVIFPLCLLIAFAAGCVSGFAMKLYYFEFWIILGLIFSYCFSKQNIKQQSNY